MPNNYHNTVCGACAYRSVALSYLDAGCLDRIGIPDAAIPIHRNQGDRVRSSIEGKGEDANDASSFAGADADR